MSDGQRVWSKFSRINKKGEQLNFIIRVWPMEKMDKIIEFQLKYYVVEEATHKAAGISENKDALNEYQTIFSMILKENKYDIFVCCLEDDTEGENIVGVSIVEISKKDEPMPDFELQTKELKQFKTIMYSMILAYNPTEKLSVDSYYGGIGVSVNPDYRGLGIAQEFLRVRRLVCKERKIPFAGAWMTTIGSQKAAQREGWETVHELDVEKFGQETGVIFKNTPPTFKFMIVKA